MTYAYDEKYGEYAMNNLAGLIEMGDVEGSLEEALKLYERSAELGNPRGCANYARFLELGKATEKDPKKALSYYKQAAELGNITGKLGYARLNQKNCSCFRCRNQ